MRSIRADEGRRFEAVNRLDIHFRGDLVLLSCDHSGRSGRKPLIGDEMTVEELAEAFERHDDDYLKSESIEAPRHRRSDIAAFLLLDELVPGTGDIVAAAEHDEIYLEVDTEALAKVITDDQVRELVRCGVRYDADVDSLAMFV